MKKGICWLLMMCLLAGCGIAAGENPDAPVWGPAEKTLGEMVASQANENMVTTVLTEPFYQGVTDEDRAMETMASVLEQLGADETTQLMLKSSRTTETGTTYYYFQQTAGDLAMFGAGAKLIVDAEGRAVCAVSSLFSGMHGTFQGELSAEEAEEVVRRAMAEDGLEPLPGLTHQAVIPMDDQEESFFAWVVYTENPWQSVETKYLAHYVNEAGEYFTLVPVSQPMSDGAMNAAGADLAFLGMEPGTWTGEVTLFDGTKRQLTVPTMKDGEGNEYLADLKRKIVCADYATWENGKELAMRNLADAPFLDGELLTFESFIRVWDLYDSIGWTGPDGEGTPVMLQMDMVDENGEPVVNAYYSGTSSGFQCFSFNRVERDGECLDLIAHEFTHCVTAALTNGMPYRNDMGAINEGFSDIMGNLVEEMLTEQASPEWLIGEGSKDPNMIIRCMSDPHRFNQPAFVWDYFFIPAVEKPTKMNDFGGVHENSSLLSLIAWRLHEAGMAPEDEFYYWMNVIMSVAPRMEYDQMAVLLPWCLEHVGEGAWMETLRQAIEETGIASPWPSRVPEGAAVVSLEVPGDLPFPEGELRLVLQEEGETESFHIPSDARTETILGVVEAGSFAIGLVLMDDGVSIAHKWTLTGGGWQETDAAAGVFPDPACAFALEAGEFYELPVHGLAESLTGD